MKRIGHKYGFGWWCKRPWPHVGPCAARPTWWNVRALMKFGSLK